MLPEVLGSDATRRVGGSEMASGSRDVNCVVVLLCLVTAAAYYTVLLSLGFSNFFATGPHGLTFNSMLLHILHGSFDVDPQAIGDEGAVHNGVTYAYFGILPALLRIPFLVSSDFVTTDFTRLSCAVAVSLMAACKLASLLTVWYAAGKPDRSGLPVLFAIAVLFGGSQIQFLRAIIFQEVILWSGALASAFVYLIIRGYYSRDGFTGRILAGLAAIAGLCLLTRVSTALGLYLALGFLMVQLAWRELRAGGLSLGLVLVRFLPAAAILFAGIALTGFINEERWGNPLSFTDPYGYLWWLEHGPDRLARYETYGLFSFSRLGFGLIYYFLPVWAIPSADSSVLWSEFQNRVLDSVELPPSSFFVSDPLLIGLAAFGLVQLVKHRDAISRPIAIPVLVGLLAPICLILTYSGMAFRYRLEFYPFFDLCAFLGFGVLLSRAKAPPSCSFAAATVASVLAAHLIGLLYMLTPLVDVKLLLHGKDLISFYRDGSEWGSR